MKYIFKEPNPSGGYSSIMESDPFLVTDELAVWPDELDTKNFYDYKGFVTLTIKEKPVTEVYDVAVDEDALEESIPKVSVVESYKVNTDAYNDYIKDHPDVEPTPEPPQPNEVTLLKAQVDSLSERNDFLEDCIAEMAGVVYNY